MPLKTFKLYGLKGIDYDAVIAKYRELCEEGVHGYEDFDMRDLSTLKPVYKREPRKPLKDNARIKNKAMFLVHSISYRQQTSKENNEDGATLQASVLQDVIGDDAVELLTALKDSGYIQSAGYYDIGRTSRRYKVIGEIVITQSSNYTIHGYIQKTRAFLNDKISKRLASKEFREEYGDKFAETYVRNLNKFKIADEKGFKEFASTRIKNNPNTEAYYDYIIEGFKNKLKIYSIDENNRIYHILTSLKRELKQFLNIKFSIDCANSHPLLFNYFILRSKGISISESYKLSSVLHSISSADIPINIPLYHYVTENLRNVLIANGIAKSKIAKFEDDELLYMWETTRGKFWDDILAEHKDDGLDRAEIKQKMFAEVFYSKTPKLAWKKFAKEFKSRYPNVYALILRWKEPLRYDDTKEILLRHKKAVEVGGVARMEEEATALPNIMMELESTIFKDILKTLFAKRICAVHIHDAIVVPDVKSTAKVEAAEVEAIMREAYKRFGLHPSFKVE